MVRGACENILRLADALELLSCIQNSLQCIEPLGIVIPMATRETNPNFMNGVPELLILKLLQQKEKYGYEIVQAIRADTDAVIVVGEGVVYPVLHGLERDGALKSRRKSVSGRSRIYYSVTPAGARRLADLSQDWRNLTAAIKKLLRGGQHADGIL
jgi:PadR family transcriptional regulator, regulatory protein PadR